VAGTVTWALQDALLARLLTLTVEHARIGVTAIAPRRARRSGRRARFRAAASVAAAPRFARDTATAIPASAGTTHLRRFDQHEVVVEQQWTAER
jgi:hypothetical protein